MFRKDIVVKVTKIVQHEARCAVMVSLTLFMCMFGCIFKRHIYVNVCINAHIRVYYLFICFLFTI